MEGSTTLHHWSRLATPHLGTLLEERPGVATRETDSEHMAEIKYSRDLLGNSFETVFFMCQINEEEKRMFQQKCTVCLTWKKMKS